jgi:hypothetical protein
MKRCFPVILTSLFLIALSGYWVLAQELKGPKIYLKEQVFDHKEVQEGAIIEHTFFVQNKGDQMLEIRNVKPG